MLLKIWCHRILWRPSNPVLESSNSLSMILWADGTIWTIFPGLQILSRNFLFSFSVSNSYVPWPLSLLKYFLFKLCTPSWSLLDSTTGQLRGMNSYFYSSNSCLIFTKIIQTIIFAGICKVYLECLSPWFCCSTCEVFRKARRTSKDGAQLITYTYIISFYCHQKTLLDSWAHRIALMGPTMLLSLGHVTDSTTCIFFFFSPVSLYGPFLT